MSVIIRQRCARTTCRYYCANTARSSSSRSSKFLNNGKHNKKNFPRREQQPQTRQRRRMFGSATTSKSSSSSTTSKNTTMAAYKNLVATGGGGALATWYSKKLDTHPIFTKAVTSGIISAAGDLICQSLVSDTTKQQQQQQSTDAADLVASDDNNNFLYLFWWWDIERTIRFFILGSCLVGPCCHVWYGVLASKFPTSSSSTALLQRVILDQFFFSPFFMSTWLLSLWTLEELQQHQRQVAGVVDSRFELDDLDSYYLQRLYDNIPPILVVNWTLWIPAQAINFRYTPIKYQVLFSNFVALLWNVYLSYTTTTTTKTNTNTT